MSDPAVAALGDTALLVTFGHTISRAVARRVRAVERAVLEARLVGVTDVVPAYTALAVYFDATRTDATSVRAALAPLLDTAGESTDESGGVIEIPVTYDGEDIADVAARTGLTVDDVVARHSAPTYYAYMLGFSPGFAYLGDLDPALVVPRRATPRVRVPAGSVAIAGAQTAVYPLVTPGGWHIVGHTTAVMFDAGREPASLVHAGDLVRFVPVMR